jgi:hypothetical protein
MNDRYAKRAALVAGLVLWPLCTLAADTHPIPPPAHVTQLIDEDLVGADRKELVHLVSANASKTAPAKILVFMVKNKGAPVSRDVPPREAP